MLASSVSLWPRYWIGFSHHGAGLNQEGSGSLSAEQSSFIPLMFQRHESLQSLEGSKGNYLSMVFISTLDLSFRMLQL
jgi:hypothetical protein